MMYYPVSIEHSNVNVSNTSCNSSNCASSTAVSGVYSGGFNLNPLNEKSVYIDVKKLFKHHNIPGTFVYINEKGKVCQVSIKEVMFCNPATIVFWDDDTKTVVRCGKDNVYDPEAGLLWAIAEKLYGNEPKETMRAWVPQDKDYKSSFRMKLKDVRKLFRK